MKEYVEIPIEKIQPNPYQPRQSTYEESLKQLTVSIKEKGILEPLVVAQKDRNYILVAGYRRIEASKKAGLTKVPCHIVSLKDKQFLEYSLIENLQREDLTPIEEAEALKRLKDEFKYSVRELAKLKRISKSETHRKLKLADAPEDVKEEVSRHGTPVESALKVAKEPDIEKRKSLLRKARGKTQKEFRQQDKDKPQYKVEYETTGRLVKISVKFDSKKSNAVDVLNDLRERIKKGEFSKD